MPRIAKVIPNKKLPRGMDFFDYIVPDGLTTIKPGDLVEAQFRNRTLVGAVDSFVDKSEFDNLKEIVGRLEYSLPSYQHELIKWFSANYYWSAGSTLSMILPEAPKRAVKIKEQSPFGIGAQQLTTDKEISKLSEQIMCSGDNKFLLSPFSWQKKTLFYVELCRLAVKSKKQILILFPQIEKVVEFGNHLPIDLRGQAAVLTNELYTSKARYFRTWQEINRGEKLIVIGTRSAVFAPLAKLAMIVADDAHSVDYKQYDQAPRYHALEVAGKIQELTGCKLILSSLTPRVEDYLTAKNGRYKQISLGSLSTEKIKVIDLSSERKKKFTYLTDELMDALEDTASKNKNAVLIVNKKGLYGYLRCNDCGDEANCPECGLPMVVETERELCCHRCATRLPMYVSCPKCQGTDLQRLGVGIESVKKQLADKFDAKSALINVCTGAGLPLSSWNNVGLLGFVYVDSLAYLADFNSNFKLISFIKELSQTCRSFNNDVQIILQTCFPDNQAFKNVNQPYATFYKEEIALRESFGYPPFATLFKLFFQHNDLKICEKEAQDLFAKLKPAIEAAGGKINEPYLHYIQKVRKRYRYQVVIFLPPMPLEKENALLKDVPEHWSIDKGPTELL
ncbi:MAG: hypothetical protein V1763_01940 [Parcubacteria group bacterium]